MLAVRYILFLAATIGLCSCRPVIADDDRKITKIIYLQKANDDLIAHCRCGDGHITYPPQIGCPWCGCGWLFTCIECRKAFSFARGVQIETSWEELARRDISNRAYKPVTDEEVAHWISTMKKLLRDVRVGGVYACIDGHIFDKDVKNIEFTGWHSSHRFEVLPQTAALSDPTVKTKVLGNESYWMKNRTSRPRQEH